MFVNNIDPVILQLGVFQIRYYGIIYALGFLIAFYFFKYYSKKGKLNLSEKEIDDLILYLLIGIVVGARILNFVFYHPGVFFTDPLQIFKIWEGGLSFHGGLIGASIAVWYFCRKKGKRVLHILDAASIPTILGLAFGRIANFTNSELYGPVSEVDWCVKFNLVDGLCRHPYQLYASISHFILFGILIYIYFKSKKEGITFYSFVLGYGAFRIFTDIWREEVKWFLGMSSGQLLSVAMVIVALYLFYKFMGKSKKVAIS